MDKNLIYEDEPFEPEIHSNVQLARTMAGHPGMIPIKAARILKPVQPTAMEETVYERIHADIPELLPYMPSFYGIKERDGKPYIVLENLLNSCKKPAVMDIKIGKSLHIREDPLRQGVYNLLGVFIHGVESSFLRLRNRVNEYVGRQVPIDDFDSILRLFFRRMGPSQAIIDRIKGIITLVKKLDRVRFYGTSLLVVFDEEDPTHEPTAHLIDFERVRIDDNTDGSGLDKMPEKEVDRLFRVHVQAKKTLAEPDKSGSAGGGPLGNIRNDTDQQLVDSAMLGNEGPDLYILRSLRHVLAIIQEEWSLSPALWIYNPGCHPNTLPYYKSPVRAFENGATENGGAEHDNNQNGNHEHNKGQNGVAEKNKIPKSLPLPSRPPLVYLVRHGERYDYTDFEWAKQAAFPHDSHLSPVGSTQAEDLADRIPHTRPALLVASPFQRAILSAVPLARRLRIPICVEPGLAEFLCEDTRTRVPGFFSSEVTVSPWVDTAYKPFWPHLNLETWEAMRLRVAYTVCSLIQKCTELGGDLIICSHRSTLTAAFEWLDESQHPNARLEYGGLALLARKDWEEIGSEHKRKSKVVFDKNDDHDARVRKVSESERGEWFAISFNEVQHLRNHILSPSSNPFRHIEGYYEDLSWDNYKKSVPKIAQGVEVAVDGAKAAN